MIALPFNPVTAVKGIAILAIVTLTLTTVRGCMKDQQAMRDALVEETAAKINAQARAETLQHANQQLQAFIETQAESLKVAIETREQLDRQFNEIRTEQLAQKQVLEGDRLSRAISGKRELVERLANRATKERFDEVENIFNSSE